MDLKRTAREVLENVGGEENIISIMSCFTRVRVELKDKTKVDEKKLKEADGCQGVNWVGNTVQIIFGGRCNDVYDELEKIVHITETEANGEKSIVKKQSVWAVMVYPAIIEAGSAGGTASFLGVPVTLVSYASSITPILISMPVVMWINKLAKKISPKVLSSLLIPIITMILSIPVVLIVTGPVATWIGNGLCGVVSFIFTKMSVVGGLLIGGAAPYLVLTGVHNGIALPITLSELASQGFSYFFPLLAYGNIAVGGAALGVWFKTKNNRLKTTAMSSCLMAVVGITEPALFGVLLPAKKPLIALGVMGAVCSAVSLMFGVKCTALSMCGLGGLPAFFGDTFVIWCILMAVSFVGAFLITILIGFKDIPEEEA